MIEKEALLKYKYLLCRRFLEQLLSDEIITEKQFRSIEKSVIKRLTEQL